jgi:hypothetical protein
LSGVPVLSLAGSIISNDKNIYPISTTTSIEKVLYICLFKEFNMEGQSNNNEGRERPGLLPPDLSPQERVAALRQIIAERRARRPTLEDLNLQH